MYVLTTSVQHRTEGPCHTVRQEKEIKTEEKMTLYL